MAFLELLFTLPKNDRNISFEQLARCSDVPVDEVELLVMRAMSLELVKGSINQVER